MSPSRPDNGGAPHFHPAAKPFAALRAKAAPRIAAALLGALSLILLGLEFTGLRQSEYFPESVTAIYLLIALTAMVVLLFAGVILRPLLVRGADHYSVEGEDE